MTTSPSKFTFTFLKFHKGKEQCKVEKRQIWSSATAAFGKVGRQNSN